MAVSAAAVVVGAQEVQERRNNAAEERRLAGLLRLSVSGPWLNSFAAADLPSDDVSDVNMRMKLNMRVQVHNDGPRDVTVTHASAGGLVLLRAPVPLPAQEAGEFLMQQTVECAPEAARPSPVPPTRQAAPGPLKVTAETSSGTRSITIEQPPYDTELAARWCRTLP